MVDFMIKLTSNGHGHGHVHDGDESQSQSCQMVTNHGHREHQNRIVVFRVGYTAYADTITNKMVVIEYNQDIFDRINIFL